MTTYAVVFLSAVIFPLPDTFYKAKIRHICFIALLFLSCLLLDYKYISSAVILNRQELIPVKAVNWFSYHVPVGVDIDRLDKNDDLRERAIAVEGEGKADVAAWRSAERVIEISAQTPLTLRIRTFNFPGWKAYIDDAQAEIKIEEGTRAMLVDIPEGNHTLVLRFEDTPIRYYSKIISLGSLFVIAFISLFSGVLLNKKRNAA